MRPDTTTIIAKGNLGGEHIDLSFDASAMAHIMGVLTNLYSDPVLAVIREYSTNAWDAHVEAGNPGPIIVTAPSVYHPEFVVQDMGIGLSADDIRGIYSKYGASTKRDTDAQTGMLGLGCKSALAYVDQFTLVGIKDGLLTTAIISRNVDGSGGVNIMDPVPTQERNGVTVTIPVKDVGVFRGRMQTFYRWWDPKMVKVENLDIEQVEGKPITDDIMVTQLGTDYIVMGNVAYPCERRLSANVLPQGTIVARVPIGTVHFAPSREALMDTRSTQLAIADIRDTVTTTLRTQAQADMDSAKTFAEAWRVGQDWKQYGLKLTYRGQEVPYTFVAKEVGFLYKPQGHGGYGRQSKTTKVGLGVRFGPELMDYVQITGFAADSVSATHRDKVEHYAQTQGWEVKGYLFTGFAIGDPWVQYIVDYTVIKALKLASRAVRAAGQQDVPIFDSNGWSTLDQAPDDAEYVLVSPTATRRYKPRGGTTLESSIATWVLPNKTFVVLGRNRWAKFLREVEGAMTIEDAIREHTTTWLASRSDAEQLAMSERLDSNSHLQKLDPDKVADPDLADEIRQYQAAVAVQGRVEQHRHKLLHIASAAEFRLDTEAAGVKAKTLNGGLDKYPFLAYNDYYGQKVASEHKYEYIRLFHAAQTTKDAV